MKLLYRAVKYGYMPSLRVRESNGQTTKVLYVTTSHTWVERPSRSCSSTFEHAGHVWCWLNPESRREEKAFQTAGRRELQESSYDRGKDASSPARCMNSQLFWVDTCSFPKTEAEDTRWFGKGWALQELLTSEDDPSWTDCESRRQNRIEDGEHLKRFLTAYSGNFELIASMLSCVQNSARPLHKSELEHAVWLSRERSSEYDTIQTMKQDLNFIVNGSDSIFVEDDMGHIDFASSSMSTFLQNFRINGIDSSHTTMARICKRAIEQFAEKAENGYRMEAGAARFLKYAYEYANYHATIVHATNQGMKFRIVDIKIRMREEDSENGVCSCSVSEAPESPTDSDWIML